MIRISDVSFIREEKTILNGVNWNVNAGEQWVLLGANGSGKTTLLEIVNGYQFPSKGKVEVLGHTYGEVDLREVRKEIGYLSQSLFEKLTPRDPLWEAVATGESAFLRFYTEISNELKERAMARLEQVGLIRHAEHPIGTLSQGERKKALLARALMAGPKLLIMDEPCSGLDIYEREKFLEVVNGLGSDATLVYVTHHIEEIIPIFTHVAMIRAGDITAAGGKKEVLTSANMERTFGVAVQLEWEDERPWGKVKGFPPKMK
ncbi:ABC transporter ATP-binding protein [Paenibacillus thermotolerans]|uniref:ABC transporter ATP-binding protein n=1 Tax=Paenibacillus thermotolerans TaxID=3027807 RepID=UPI0023686972|nr:MULTISPECIES: ATP-binding cassette domain-containing protein [unclassified Paenibacillus]